jgi:2-polyprenyl-3-methyl-5-hydroxy-6-metoxy-1,4-benzoquinol methylase
MAESSVPDEHPARAAPLRLEAASCCLCRNAEEMPVGIGEDFEYHVTGDVFLAMQCGGCGTVYLKQRPVAAELDRVYPPNYHAFDFSSERFGLAYAVRQRLEARRLLAHCRDLPADARILDIGCGDGFHLKLLRRFGAPTWELEGVDASERAATAGSKAGLHIHHGTLEELPASCAGYHLVLLIATIEHVGAPLELLSAAAARLRPGGRLLLATDNAGSWSYGLFHRRYWGGYHFPRHWYLFRKDSLRTLALQAGLEVESLGTMMSPVNWVYSIHNALVDWGAPTWLVNRFTLSSPVSLAAFSILGSLQQALGKGELLHAVLRRPTVEEPLALQS